LGEGHLVSVPRACPIPEMIVYGDHFKPSGLYRIELEIGSVIVGETADGYVGFWYQCPHQERDLEEWGQVKNLGGVPSLFCRAHAIYYSLETGECLKNRTADDPRCLKLMRVERVNDQFLIYLE
jgi:nitrite reductase/ring-hydroxylating ferredoxin subunit